MSKVMKKQNFLNFVKYRLPVILWGITIIVVSSLPHIPSINNQSLPLDKIIHFIEYGVFSYLLVRSFFFNNKQFFKERAVLLTFIISIIFAAGDEIHQTLIPGRIGSLSDFWADLGGIFLSQILFIKLSISRIIDENN